MAHDDLLQLHWDGNAQEISSHGYRSFPIHGKHVVLYADPLCPTEFRGIHVRLDIAYIGVYRSLTEAAQVIQKHIEVA